jgi:hypothetical protein
MSFTVIGPTIHMGDEDILVYRQILYTLNNIYYTTVPQIFALQWSI